MRVFVDTIVIFAFLAGQYHRATDTMAESNPLVPP